MQMFAALYLLSAAICCFFAGRGQAHFVDLRVYRMGGDAVLHGSDLYAARYFGLPFTYPPFAAVLCAGLAVLPWSAAVALLSGCGVAALALALYLALRLPRTSGRLRSRVSWILALAGGTAAIWLEPVRTAIGYGQIDLIIACCVLYDLSLRDGSPHRGVAIGIAAGLKLTPAIFVPYLLLTRRYRAAATAAAAFAGTVAIGWLVLPASSLRYWNVTFLNPRHIGLVQDPSNQSLLGVLARNLHTPHVTWLWLPLAVIVAATGLTLAALAGRRGDEGLGFCLCAITGLLISPISWTHHWVIAVPAVLLIAVEMFRHRHERSLWVTIAGISAFVALTITGWSGIARRMPGTDWLHLPFAGLMTTETYAIAALAALAFAALTRGERRVADGSRNGPATTEKVPSIPGGRNEPGRNIPTIL